ncbi:precorrin-3B synthase [Sedimentitalea nanhaiensis]|uniref:Precorrin-3B synthase n=1 Tax=Sedimentitalea nanhaiensis TaxID=999627 RepID=A0A1I7BQG8_9RHOB|nr:precorrin-3B synthase [Sedimentitalea nanhaiensis]SFT89430.1 precorrin-3B synthase [Sedimentitalea nanhaiensis]
MSAPVVKGWCPGAHRPMMSGDGLVVRVRPRMARLTAEQVLGLCDAAQRHGNGRLDLTNRANLQLRGVSEQTHRQLLDDLANLDLLDPEPGLESRRNILVQPFYEHGDQTCRLTEILLDRLADLPELPAKFGFAIDTGSNRVLSENSADIRLETGMSGGLILRADGSQTGVCVSEERAIDAALGMARWFARHSSPELRRMRNLVRHTSLPGHWTGKPPGPLATRSEPGFTPKGPLVGAAFGQILALALDDLIRKSGARALRITPWRQILLEGGHSTPAPGFVTRPDDPLLTADACSGAPICPQAQAETQMIARQMAGRIGGSLHVSGCTKGCARQTAASVTLVGRNGRFDLVKRGRAGDEPAMRGLTPEDLLTLTDLT